MAKSTTTTTKTVPAPKPARTDSKGNKIPTLEEQLMQDAKDKADREKAQKAYDSATDRSMNPSDAKVIKKRKGGMVSSVKPRGMSLMKKTKACKMY